MHNKFEVELYHRQIDRAKELVNLYTNGKMNIDDLLNDLEAIGVFFEQIDQKWYENFQTEINNLEVLNAMKYNDNRIAFTKSENIEIFETLNNIVSLLEISNSLIYKTL